MNPILHIAHRGQWQTAQTTGSYQTESLESEGFIHCSKPEQVLKPANDLYRGQPGLVLLVVDPNLVQADIIYEDCYETGEEFPHIYGPLNVNAVIQVVDFPPNEDGFFSLPPAITRGHL